MRQDSVSIGGPTLRPRGFIKHVLVATSVVGVVALAAMGAYLALLRYELSAESRQLPPRRPGGAFLLCGGGEIPAAVYERFVHLSGGAQGRLVVIPSYAATAADIARITESWKRRGIGSVAVLHASDRARSDDPSFAAPLAQATAVWLTGGLQEWLADRYAETEVERQLKALVARGGIVGGTSAGASAMSRVMIASGFDEAVKQRGLDLLPTAIVDQHFLRRNRLQRLVGVLDAHPGLIGLGIDEATAVLIEANGTEWSVLGDSYALVCVPGQEKFPRIEVLKPGDSTCIDRLKERPGVYAIASPAILRYWLDGPENE